MFKKDRYISSYEIIKRLLELEANNRLIDIYKLKKISFINNELLEEFIATNSIEGDIINFSLSKKLNNTEVTKTNLEKRWIGIKYASELIWSDKYKLNIEFIKEVHRALMRKTNTVGGVWKTKINKVGSLITSHPDDVNKELLQLLNTYLITKLEENTSLFSIIPFISSFLAIHPFQDGNGRISRLILNRELYNAGYKFVKYISISKYLQEDKKNYILALEHRNKAWASKSLTEEDHFPLFIVILDALIKASKESLYYLSLRKYNKEEFVKLIKSQPLKPFSLSEIMKRFSMSNSTSSVTKWLNELVKDKLLKKKGKLKATKYFR